MKIKYLLILLIVVFILGAGYWIWEIITDEQNADNNQQTESTDLYLYFTTSTDDDQSMQIARYNMKSHQWEVVHTFTKDLLAFDTGQGFLLTPYFGKTGDSQYYSYNGAIRKDYLNYQIQQYQEKNGIVAYIGTNDAGNVRRRLFVEQDSEVSQWLPDDLDIPSNKNFDWIDIADDHTIFYSYYESTGDAQREMHLSRLDIQTGEHELLFDVLIEEDPQYLGYDPLTDEVFISRSLFQNGFFLESYNTTSQATRELYRTETSYMLGHLPLRNNVIVFGEHTYGMSDRSLKKFNVITGVVDTILQGEDLPMQWVDDNHVIVMHAGASSVIDIRSGDIVDLGDEFKDHSTLYPLRKSL